MHRPTKLTPAVQERILAVLVDGNYVETAARAAGIAERTFYLWMERGDPAGTARADRPYRDFRAAVARVRAHAEMTCVRAISRAAARSEWRAAAWMLEHEFPERWAINRPQSSEAPDGRPV